MCFYIINYKQIIGELKMFGLYMGVYNYGNVYKSDALIYKFYVNNKIEMYYIKDEKYYIQKYFDVIKILEKIEPIIPIELLAEKDLLLSLVLTKTLNPMDRIKAAGILSSYQLISSVNNEFDLWLRIMMTYMTSNIHLGKRNEAMQIEKEL